MWLPWVACTYEPADPARLSREAEQQADIRRDAERRMVHGTELALLWRTASDALRDGRPAAAAAAVALGMEVDQDRFSPLVERVAETEDPAALSILASRVDRRRFGDRAERSEVDRRYARAVLGETLSRYEGVDRRRGQRVLSAVDAEYVVEPDARQMTDAVGARFRQLYGSAEVRAAFPRWTGGADGESVMKRIDLAVSAGLPEAVAVGEGIGAALGSLDPYTRPVWPASLTEWEEHHAGASVGVGIELLDHTDSASGATAVYVGVPGVGGPAWEAGVHAGDRIVGVGGGTVAGLDSHGVAERLRGEAGTRVALEVVREGRSLTFDLTRASIREQTVTGFRRTVHGWDPWIGPGIALVRISAFRPHTDEELDAWIPDELPAVVLLDLRGNGGGDVMAAVNVADRFIEHGDVAHLQGRTLASPAGGPNGEVPWNVAIPGHPLEHLPVVVMVDRDTASAAELVAGALRELANATLVGEQTYGKGLSQALRVDAELGVGWQVTDGTWLLPSRRALEAPGGERTGLVPDVLLTLSPAERLQVRAMRRTRELPPVHPDGTPVPDLGTVARSELPRLSDDPQLAEALRVARSLR